MIGIDEALDRLLRDGAARAAYAAHGATALGVLAEEDVEALAAIDLAELERLAARARRELFTRRHRGTGGLLEWYPRTIAAWRVAHGDDPELDDLAGTFLASAAGGTWRELPAADDGVSLEEAFHRFACAADIGDAATREEEFLAAMVKAVVLAPDPGFRVPVELRRVPGGAGGVYAVARGAGGGPPKLFAALGGRFVSGPLTPFLADLLTGEDAAAVARRHGVSDGALAASLAELARLGLR